jgi:hypothetical protein
MGLCPSGSKPEVQQEKPHILGNKHKVSWTSGSMFEVFGATSGSMFEVFINIPHYYLTNDPK